ncbi:hypothetical protein D1007_41349 [Hordeum vulgare]|nr:hypothetical protein D1007_41349 [Hordeum vulgare]
MAAATPGGNGVMGGYDDLPSLGRDDHVVSDAIWDVRIQFDLGHNLDRNICSSDATFLNIYALLTTLRFNFSDELYHMKNTDTGADTEHVLELIETNVKLQQLKKQYEDSLVLNLLVRAPVQEFVQLTS